MSGTRLSVDEDDVRFVVQRPAWSAQAIATALGVAPRTAARYKAEFLTTVDITVAGWTATFVVRRHRPPARIRRWRRGHE